MPPVAAEDTLHSPGSVFLHQRRLPVKRLQKINVIRSPRIPQHNAAVTQQPFPLEPFQRGIPEQGRKTAGIQGKKTAQGNGSQQTGHAEPFVNIRQRLTVPGTDRHAGIAPVQARAYQGTDFFRNSPPVFNRPVGKAASGINLTVSHNCARRTQGRTTAATAASV